MKRILILTAVTLLTTSAFAAETDHEKENKTPSISELKHQSAAGQWEVTPQLGYSTLASKNKSGAAISEVDLTTTGLGVKAAYGFSDTLEGSLLLNDASGKSTTKASGGGSVDSTASGLQDPTFEILARADQGNAWLRYGADLGINIDKQKQDSTGAVTNQASGGMSLNAFVGYEWRLAAAFWGLEGRYDLYKGDRKVDNNGGSGATVSKGNALTVSAYYEWILNPTTNLGVNLSVIDTAATSTDIGSGSSDDKNHKSEKDLQIYVPVAIAHNMELIPSFTYTIVNSDVSGVDTVGGWAINVPLRIEF